MCRLLHMATNLHINDQLLEEAQKLGGFRTKRETVDAALAEFVRLRIRQEFLSLENAIDYYDDHDFKQARKKR